MMCLWDRLCYAMIHEAHFAAWEIKSRRTHKPNVYYKSKSSVELVTEKECTSDQYIGYRVSRSK